MEKKLEKYRAQKRRTEIFENFKAKLRKMVSFGSDSKKEEDVIKIVRKKVLITDGFIFN